MRDDPFEAWRMYDQLTSEDAKTLSRLVSERQAQVHTGLQRLAAILDATEEKPKLTDIHLAPYGGSFPLAPDDLALAQELYWRVFHAGGTGNQYMQEQLLELIAAAKDPASVPFWLATIELKRPRDPFAKKRWTLAVAALARQVMIGDAPAAYDALRGLAHHDSADIRALAVHYVGRAYFETERPYPPELQSDLNLIATQDADFRVRYQARFVLSWVELPIPLDNPGGVYALKVYFQGDKSMYRIIEDSLEDTLDALHWAIQNALGWDDEHLYSFYMNGERYDERYQISCPYEEDALLHTTEISVGELGLGLKAKFLYHFDYGDDHRFDVEVVDIQPKAVHEKYPRVVKKFGKAPPQYIYGDDEEDAVEDSDADE